MRALHFDGRDLAIKDIPLPILRPGEALVKVHLAGICRTDLEIFAGYMSFLGVPGHEFVGTVQEVSTAPPLLGRRVVGEISAACGVCAMCLAGLRRHCASRTVLGISNRDGAFADYLVLPEVNLHEVPADLPDSEAVFAEPLAAAMEVLEQVSVGPQTRAAVLGDGKLGLLVAMVLALSGAETTLVAKHERRVSDYADVLSGTRVLTLEKLDRRERYPLIVECTGRPEGLDLALELAPPRGTVVLKSTCAGRRSLDLNRVVIEEITLIGSRCGQLGAALRLLERRALPVARLISAIYPLPLFQRAFAEAAGGSSLKVLLDFGAGE